MDKYLFFTITIVATVYGQIVLRWQMAKLALPAGAAGKALFLAKTMFINPWVLSVPLAAAVAMLSWMVVLSKVKVSTAYPFMSLSFILVTIIGGLILKEPVGFGKIVGLALIVAGVVVTGLSANS